MTDARGANAPINAGGALLMRLKVLGVDYLFANSGSDFPPLIEAIAQAAEQGLAMPEPVIAPHENAAMGMAHGYYLATGRPQAVMVHTNVGLANAAIGAINAACDHVPVVLCSGRTPVTEHGRLGARGHPISWGQEMRDQAALVRECVKWDFELRFPEQVAELADRAVAIAMSLPRGPVYMSLPREVLCATCPAEALANPPHLAPAIPAPRAGDVARAAELLAGAARPLVIAQRGPGSVQGFATLARLAEAWALPVVQFWPTHLSLSWDHPMHAGFDPAPWLADADAVLVIDALTPWLPSECALPADCPVVQVGQDPLFSRFPVRGFRADLALTGEVPDVLAALEAALAPALAGAGARIAARREDIVARNRAAAAKRDATAKAGAGRPMTKAWASRCVAEAVEAHDGIALSELGCEPPFMRLTRPGSLLLEPHSGGLGWGFPAALGLCLADRDRLVVASVGDGAYMFANPVACHQIAESLALPALVVILNNASWNAVRRGTLEVYPSGFAARANRMPLIALQPSPDFVKIAEASRGWARRVDDGAELPAALAEAIEVVRTERRQALLDVQVAA